MCGCSQTSTFSTSSAAYKQAINDEPVEGCVYTQAAVNQQIQRLNCIANKGLIANVDFNRYMGTLLSVQYSTPCHFKIALDEIFPALNALVHECP